MKAIQVENFGGPEVMELVSIPVPVPATGQVLVTIKAAGVNPVDTYIRAGQYARKPALPYIPGIDGAGVVEAVGADVVDAFQVGDRVYGGWPLTGTYAEQTLYGADQLYHLPQGVAFDQGAGIFVPYSTAYRALFIKGKAKAGETVLIHGATGSVGLAAVQLATAAGLQAVGTGGSVAGRQQVLEQGAVAALDHHEANYLQAIRSSLGGVDVVLEMLANVNLEADLQVLNPGGRVVVIGSRGRIEIAPRDIMAREAMVTGLSLFNTPTAEMNQIQAALAAGLRQGTLNPIVSQRLPLAEAAQAHHRVISPGASGNIVLLPGEAAVPYSND